MKKRSLSITSILLTTILALSGCGSASADSTVQGASAEQEEADVLGAERTADGEKVLNVGLQQVPDQPFNPGQITNTWNDIEAPIFEALIKMDGNGEYSPNLATSWELADDSLSFTLKLRDDVKFSDGSDFTSEDVKFTLEYYGKEESTQADSNLIRKYIKDIETPDDYTVVLNFNEPVAEFEYLLSSNGTGTGLILPSDYFEQVGEEEFGKKPVGTGPFVLESFTAGDSAIYTVNENYWGTKPGYDRLVIRQYAEESTRVAALQAGEIDFAPIGANSVATIEGTDGISVEESPYASTLGLFIAGAYDNTGEALQDAKVREALSLAINREELVSAVFEGNAVAAGVWGLYPFTYGYDDSRKEAAEYNPEKAKELLTEAGYPDNFADPVIPFYFGLATVYADDVAQALIAYWEEIGLQVNLIPIDPTELGTLRKTKPIPEEFEGAVYFFNPPKKYSAYDAFAPFYPSTSRIGLIQGNETLDKAVDDIIALYGEDRVKKVDEVLDIIEQEKVSVPVVYPGEYYAVSSRIKSFDKNASGHLGYWFQTFELN
ncbi:ABC transporter substrate-binding protein [Butyrivibrio sp. AE3004]|uniref:ABC transporter substrate-binding protein n=1 Tax=Butyrivibrio sp. AE3004 TaxID=1506994 RepID=UPI000494BDB0|nr:ABC transporter substrate-binding protein [Butyrivibrio sp. AE3004]